MTSSNTIQLTPEQLATRRLMAVFSRRKGVPTAKTVAAALGVTYPVVYAAINGVSKDPAWINRVTAEYERQWQVFLQSATSESRENMRELADEKINAASDAVEQLKTMQQ